MPANLVFRRKIWGARDNGIPPRSTPDLSCKMPSTCHRSTCFGVAIHGANFFRYESLPELFASVYKFFSWFNGRVDKKEGDDLNWTICCIKACFKI